MITQDRLKELFHYDPAIGVFVRKPNRVCKGINVGGYVQIMIDGTMYYGHRLAWFYVNGEWPGLIDHINGVRGDNRLANLREVSDAQNTHNVSRHKDNKSGFKGVFRNRKRWTAQICKSGAKECLGTFDTPEQAHAAYWEAAQRLFGEFARA